MKEISTCTSVFLYEIQYIMLALGKEYFQMIYKSYPEWLELVVTKDNSFVKHCLESQAA